MSLTDSVNLISVLATLVSVFVAIAALIASKQAKSAATAMNGLDQRIELSLSRFKEDIVSQGIFANNEIVDIRLKGVDNSLRDINHRTNRNTDHITILISALLKSGVDIVRLSTANEQERRQNG